ncbi:carbohydrate ABC transporter membrane protein 1, CUT1 family [Haladaptatus litoreus]|uniref:Carbohydrate ABC transporter membrane protein 1, CUT1 family n=1 Tax=Haladaptatus litoreus TaxID=553468 RepID=A0A1N7CR48_9EURY|nr:sugar ABC transporter permease [Haladaptatus litoreus]SIR66062.1 carbohydrate ABC transporter membrane protein 1, CUT1 family [Haladaptatus litoreus]
MSFEKTAKRVLPASNVERAKRWLGLTDEQNNLSGYLFVLPNVIVFSIFLLAPVLYAFYLSFNEWNILTAEGTWVGLQNYVSVLTPLPWENNWAPLRDPTANLWWYSMKNTVVYAVGTVPLQIYGGLAVALMLDKRIRGKKVYRAAYFMPVMLSGAASAVIWIWLLSSNGIINSFLQPLGLAHNWIGDPSTALGGLILMAIWGGIGFNMILFLAGLQNIPDELYEAARIDGASRWHRFRHVTWPNLGNTSFFVLVMAIIGSFQVFGTALVFSDGGPYYSTTTVVLLIYQRAFEEGQMGVGAAMAFILFLIIFVFSYYQYRYRKSEEVEY